MDFFCKMLYNFVEKINGGIEMADKQMKVKEPLTAKHYVLGIQHLFAMFGATVLVPMLTGLNPGIALLCAGLGTLLFHFVTKGRVPVFLGSSFAFIGAIITVVGKDLGNIPLAQGGIIVAGLVYLIFAALAFWLGADKIKSLFPPIVTGPVIMVIGLNLSPTAIASSNTCWPLAIITIIIIITVMCKEKSFFKLVPILFGIGAGYLLAFISDITGLTSAWNLVEGGKFLNFELVSKASWFINISNFTIPKFDAMAITLIAPIALVTFMEHIGDITTNGMVVGQNFFEKPGLHRTLIGDGLATALAGLLGGPPNTTYSENTGVLAVTKNYDPRILRITAIYAIILGLFGKFGSLLQTIPTAVMGGVSMILFGMIASIGLRSLVEAKVDLSKSRNLVIAAFILVLGLGFNNGINIPIGSEALNVSGLFIATIVGVIANKILPQNS